MSDNTQRTELLTRLYEQNLITEDQLSRAKLYLQFISNVSFDSQDGAIDWLLENRIISERPVTNEAAIEQVTQNINENVSPEPSSNEISSEKVPAEQDSVEENLTEDTPEQDSIEESLTEDTPEQDAVDESLTEDTPEQDTVDESLTEDTPEQDAVDESLTEDIPEQDTVDENLTEDIPEQDAVDESLTEDTSEQDTVDESLTEDTSEQDSIEESLTEDIPEQDTVDERQSEDISEQIVPEEIVSNAEIVIEEIPTGSGNNNDWQPESLNIEHDEISSADSDVLEMLMLLYYSGIINERTIKKAKTALSQYPDIHFKDSDELLAWLEKRELVKKSPTNAPQKKKKKSPKPKQYIAPPKSTVKLPPSITPAPVTVKKSNGGCLKKLLILGVAAAILIAYLMPSSAPECNNIKIAQQLNQSFNAIDDAKSPPNHNRLQKILGKPIIYRLNSLTGMSQTAYDDESRVHSCTASVTYKATGKDKTATDIIEEFSYQIAPTSKDDFTVNIEDSARIIRKVNGENAYYNMLHEKEQNIKIAFLAGLMQLDKIISGGKTSQYMVSMPEKVTWIKPLGECQVTKDPYYICSLSVGYNDGLTGRLLDDENKNKELELHIDMPVIKKDDKWYPTNGFFNVFLTAYQKAHEATGEENQTKASSPPANQAH
ncbi:hypothetical protein I2494_08650 [Budviciaceae bacterium BWR-B9]|uniref:Uncharacterized protein n=1 Tax=Limnobaculum allomyrinae TaxID=2791986 RepID=A0ABS1IPX0_9GAMM|nr:MULTISPECIES: hypothetical protein [Limnobaculum]MBK5143784.1 hypothetical protein [Limnobaculum allomyrinae]MBV7693523.1 hypothetical protein [Limnobaculum sp. M2-1]